MPKVSIIIPTYNRQSYLSGVIKSVLDQTFDDFEVVLIDDGSTDQTKEVVEKYINTQPDKIKYFYQGNKGPSAARNNGIKQASGEYIAFLDDDDEWLPDKLKYQIDGFSQNQNIGLVYTDYYIIVEGSSAPHIHHCEEFNRARFETMFYIKNLISTPTIMVRKKCFEKAGLFDENLDVAEDWDMWLRLFRRYDFLRIPQPLVKVNVNAISQSSDGDKNLANDLKFLDKIFSEPGIKSKALKAKSYSYRYYKAAIAYRENGNIKKMRNAILKSIMLYPLIFFSKDFFYFIFICVFRRKNNPGI